MVLFDQNQVRGLEFQSPSVVRPHVMFDPAALDDIAVVNLVWNQVRASQSPRDGKL